MTLTRRGRIVAAILIVLTAATVGFLTAPFGTACYMETIR